MTPPTPDQFAEFFKAVHGYDPFPWQSRLAERVCGGNDWPRAIALPTAAGKTACMDVAVFALACRVTTAPRRIFFVVDRRIVVDQAKLHADALATKLKGANGGILKTVADSLRELAQDERPLDVYALRGGMYRETAWARSPLQPTVIASTVDQVGSRLLFRGYGVSDSMKPVHAALVGNDAIILLDEAHCAKPFEQTVRAVENYRGWRSQEADESGEVQPPFRFVSITATPTGEVEKAEKEREVTRPDDPPLIAKPTDADLTHQVLGARISARKPAALVTANKRQQLGALQERAESLMGASLGADAEGKEHVVQAVGVIVNRVKTARELAKLLRTPPKTKKGETPVQRKVILLTGRMRPLDRDAILKDLEPLFSGSKRALDGPTFVVATQCLEVGADLDFHALVSECASLDALRQRFGRLNRVAARPGAKAVVVCPEEYAEPKNEEKKQDPIYRNSMPHTWQWLLANQDGVTDEKEPWIDFGAAAMTAKWDAAGDDTKANLNAPAPDAPVLFPAHLDCWVQTHPTPHPDPDVAVFLHGPKQTGQADVQVVLRNDLGDDDEKWAEVVALLPPSSSEAVAVPIGLFKKWLAGEPLDQTDPGADIEGGTPEGEDEPQVLTPRKALCWMGADESAVVKEPRRVRPNRTYVIPSTFDARQLADFIGDPSTPPEDYAEEAFQRSRDQAVLRLRDVTVTDEMEDDDADALVQESIASLNTDDAPEWRKRAAKELAAPKRRRVLAHPAGGVVALGKRRLHQFDPEFLDDANSSYSPARRQVTLVDHSRGVADRAVRFARPLALPETTFQAAGHYHDLGKLDPRFQRMLVGFVPKDPLAKSGTFAQRAWESHRYPKGARHELLSAALLAGHTSDDLLLHLIATHHGSARPFAEPVVENEHARAPFVAKLFDLEFNHPTAAQDIAGWNAELPERFWRVVREYGWWGSAFRETVFRLADHAQSRAEQEKDEAPTAPADVQPPPLRPFAEPRRLHPLSLPGLDGSNPLAFLAALGTLRLADKASPGTRLSWALDGVWIPTLHLPEPKTNDELLAMLLASASAGRRCLTFAPDVKIPADEFRRFEREAVDNARHDREFADFLRAFADPLVTIQGGPNAGRTKPTEFYFIAGLQKLLEIVLAIAQRTTTDHIRKCLWSPWVYDDAVEKHSIRWDPADDNRYATRWRNPSGDPVRKRSGSVLGANRLAFEAFPLFPCFAAGERLTTTGFMLLDRSPHFTWPLWSAAWSVDVIRSMLCTVGAPDRKSGEQQVKLPSQLGVRAWYQCEKVANSDYSNFAPSRVVG